LCQLSHSSLDTDNDIGNEGARKLSEALTILHSAVKSNNVKMIRFILNKISPSTKQRMMEMKNVYHEVPIDFLTVWSPSIHSLFPLKFRQLVKKVLMLGAKGQDGTPYYPQTHFYKLPIEVLFLILQHAVPQHIFTVMAIEASEYLKQLTVRTVQIKKGSDDCSCY
jgi:hypothetical protein